MRGNLVESVKDKERSNQVHYHYFLHVEMQRINGINKTKNVEFRFEKTDEFTLHRLPLLHKIQQQIHT